MKFNITIIRPPGVRWSLCFLEMAKSIQWALEDLGHNVQRQENHIDADRTNIVFSWHDWWQDPSDPALHPVRVLRDNEMIIYQGEQLAPGGRPMPEWYLQGLREAAAVWEYSPDHIQLLLANECNVKHVPPGWHPSQCTIDYQDTPKTNDICFVGALNARREFLMKLLHTFCKTATLCDVWGHERDQTLAASKLVANIHFYESQTLETLRLSHCLANSIPVLSEPSPINPYEEGIAIATYREFAATVLHLLGNNDLGMSRRLIELGEKGHEIYRRTTMMEIVEEALAKPTLPPSEPVPVSASSPSLAE